MKTIFGLFVISFVLFSCQKEITGGVNGGGNGNTNGLLVKAVAVTGTDTMTTVYGYDSQNRLETITMDGKTGGFSIHSYQKFERDGTGRISRILQKVDQNGMIGDTAFETIHYPSAGVMEYDYAVNTMSFLGISSSDSMVYSYSSGAMTSFSTYISAFGQPTFLSSRDDFTYDASGRVSVIKVFSSGSTPGSPLSQVANETYTYGTALSGFYNSGNAAQNNLLSGTPSTSSSAAIKLQEDDLTTPSNSTTITTTYTLSGNKAITAKVTTSAGQVTNYTFYYQ